jgi:hypothetical protein
MTKMSPIRARPVVSGTRASAVSAGWEMQQTWCAWCPPRGETLAGLFFLPIKFLASNDFDGSIGALLWLPLHMFILSIPRLLAFGAQPIAANLQTFTNIAPSSTASSPKRKQKSALKIAPHLSLGRFQHARVPRAYAHQSFLSKHPSEFRGRFYVLGWPLESIM